MGIVTRLRRGASPTTWPAEEVLVRFESDGVADVALMKGGKGMVRTPGDELDSLESSDAREFAVVLVDQKGHEVGRYGARWLDMRGLADYDVVFGDEPKETAAGLRGDVMAAKVAPTGQVVVKKVRIHDS